MNNAVLVLDVQQGTFMQSPRPFEADEVIERINQITQAARQRACPVLIFQAEYPGVLTRGSEAWQLAPGLKVEDSDILTGKTQANAFLQTELHTRLQKLNIEQLVLCGYASEFCIDSTARYASALGYRILLATDAHTTHDKQHLSAEKIRQHHNLTLCGSPVVNGLLADDVSQYIVEQRN